MPCRLASIACIESPVPHGTFLLKLGDPVQRMYYETSETHVWKATPRLKALHESFLGVVLSHAHIPDSHTLLVNGTRKFKKRESEELNKPVVTRRLLQNVPNFPERLEEYFARYNLNAQPNAATLHEDDLYNFPSSYHFYFLSISPSVNYTEKRKTKIEINWRGTYTFDGFLLVSQQQLDHVPPLCFQQYGHNYLMRLEPAAHDSITTFTVMDALVFEEYLFNELLQLYDFTRVLKSLGKRMFFVPRFSRPAVHGSGIEVLTMADILQWMVDSRKPFLVYLEATLREKTRNELSQITDGWIVTNPNAVPSSIRIDRIEWPDRDDYKGAPHIVHFSSVFNESRAEREVHSSSSRAREKQPKEVFRFSSKEIMLSFSTECFHVTGIYTDLVQLALVLPLLAGHILFHDSLSELEEKLHYRFRDRQLLERALTHPSYSHFGAVFGKEIKMTASNCGLRKPRVKEDWRNGGGADVKETVQHAECQPEEERLRHNEQLEFLGDAALEFLCSLHLYHMLPSAKLGQLASYRTVLVRNKHLAILAERLQLHTYLLVENTTSSDHPVASTQEPPASSSATAAKIDRTVHMDAVSHTAANTLEAVLGAVYLDAGLHEAQKLTARLFFPDTGLYTVWMGYPPDLLQQEHPEGDRHLIAQFPVLQYLVELEKSTGVEFTHICLLAKAFTHSSMPYTSLVGGSYEKLEHLGDAVLQFLASDFVFRKFPTLHEGHLSLLRTTLVQNKQLARLCKQLGFDQFIRTETPDVGTKILADVIESYLAVLLLDKGLDYCQKFLEVCLFPKLSEAVENSAMVDANTQLQKAVARLCRQLHIKHESPHYRYLKTGPSGNPPFTVGVYFKGQRLGTGVGASLRDARQNAAESALEKDALNQLWWGDRCD